MIKYENNKKKNIAERVTNMCYLIFLQKQKCVLTIDKCCIGDLRTYVAIFKTV